MESSYKNQVKALTPQTIEQEKQLADVTTQTDIFKKDIIDLETIIFQREEKINK